MTEAEWLHSCEWLELWWHIPDERLTDRKMRLFAAACCRRISHRLVDSWTMQVLQVGESFADGAASAAELATAYRQLRHIAYGEYPPTLPAAEWAAAAATAWVCHQDPFKVCRAAEEAPSVDGYEAVISAGLLAPSAPPDVNALSRHAGNRNGVVIPAEWGLIWQHEVFQRGEAVGRQHQAAFLRDIIGDPFRHVAVDSAWLTATVKSLAQAVYNERAFDRLPILADALEDAGCDNADILNHCRQPGEHCRGCWVLDFLLDKK